MRGYDDLDIYYGDLHNHCNVGYGHGSIEDAFHNAQLQLDFASVTVHAHWPDIPEDDARLADAVAYHKDGFRRTREQWPHVQEVVEDAHDEGRFVSFLGFEWHSMAYGDHNVYFNGSRGEIIRAGTLEELRVALRRLAAQGTDCFVIPHHIGYERGYRGINWDAFTPEFSPVVEIMSMHGASESDTAPYPYLHTMGPRDLKSTFHYGLAQGHVAGVIGSTDHHSAHPGSYGHGRAAVWAETLTRDAIWDAIRRRRTYALTGDRIELRFSVNGRPMGGVLRSTEERNITVSVSGGDALDYIEVLHNNAVLHREDLIPLGDAGESSRFKVYPELGWGERGENVDWNVELHVEAGRLLDVEPRFRGHEVLAPQAGDEEAHAFSDWERVGPDGVRFVTRTWGNPTTTTASTQGVCLEVEGDTETRITGTINGQRVDVTLGQLRAGAYTEHVGGFLTPAFCLHRAVPETEYMLDELILSHQYQSDERDWYTVRVRQKNGQWAWSSPIWIEGSST